MGIPLTTYTVLDSLALGKADPHFRRLVSPFNLFAFLLGSPVSDPILFSNIESKFHQLAFETGEKFLFFALAEPSYNLRGGGRSGAYARFLEFQPPSISPYVEAALADALALGLDIPQSALPCIVATTDLNSKDLVWFTTSADSVREQLRGLGYLAWQHDRRQVKAALIDQVRHDQVRGGSATLNSSVAKAIANVLSVPIYRAGRSDVRTAADRARRTLSGIFQTIKAEKGNILPSLDDEPEPSALQKLESSAIRGLACLSLLNENADTILYPDTYQVQFLELPSDVRDVETMALEEEYETEPAYYKKRAPSQKRDFQRWPYLRQLGRSLEPDSVYMLKTSLLVQDLFDSQPELVHGVLDQQLDYTPTVICLAKVFENEVNLSVVHWIRSYLKIILPTYFNRYQPDLRAIFSPNVPNPHEIDFNKERNGTWIAPAMGQSELACRELSRTQLPEGWTKSKWSRLMSGWHVIRIGRNAATHTQLIDKESAMRMGNEIDRLARDEIFEVMYALKVMYRGF